MCVIDTKEQSVRVKKLILAPEHVFQNECALWYWASVWLKMNQRKFTPLYEKDKNKIKRSMETTKANTGYEFLTVTSKDNQQIQCA